MPKGKKVKSDAPPTKKQVSEGAATGVAADSSKAVAATAPKPDKSAPSPAQKNEPKPVDQGKTGGNGNEKKNDKQEEMDAERELADDAAWKRIQQNTFTRWANEHLKTANKNIGSLETDLADGLRLIALIEVLSAKKLGKHNKKPSFRSQKLENCSVALKFLMQDEGIKIVNIDSTDIVDCKLKLILGLIWTLILHYSISMPMWEGEDEGQTKGKSATPKQRLLGWIKSKVPDLPIQNFTSDWNNGKAIGALVDAVAPGLCPDWEDWDPKNALKNAQEAMELANKWLDVPELIRPAELTNPNIDEMSVMTYLSQFPKAKLKPGAPLRPRTNPKKVRAYGPGIEPSGVICGVPTNFTVETFSAGKGDVEVEVQNSKNQKEPAEIKYNDDKAKTFTVKYTPKMEGPHKVKVNFAGKEIPKSPFPVEVKGFTGDPGKVVAKGPGLEPTGVIANKPTHFDVDTREAGLGCIDVLVEDPDKSTNTVPCKVTDNGDGTYHCEYAPNKEGDHNVNVLFAGRLASQSPFKVNVAPSAYPHKVVAKGPGLEPTGVRATNPTYFDIDAREAGLGKAEVTIEDPDKSITTVPLKVTDKGDGTYRCEYEPKKEGMHNVTVKFAGKPIQKDPFKVNVGPATDPSQVVAKGPGLEPNGVTASKPTSFDVDTTAAGVGKLEVSIEDPEKSTKTVPCKIVDKGNGAYHCEYEPKKSGLHNVNITLAGKPIQKSPFKVNVGPASDARKVRASGRGLQANGVRVADAADFKIYTDGAGDGQVDVKVVGPNGQPIAIEMKKLTPTTYETIYRPTMVGRHVVLISYGGTEIPKSPYEVNVGPFKESKIRAFGPGLYGGMVNKPASFTVETNGETGSLGFSIEGPSQTKIDCKDNGDGSANVTYYPTAPGDYAVHILCDNEDIPKSPYMAAIIPEDPKFSPEKVEAYGPGLEENGVAMGKPTEFTIDTKKAGGTGPLEVSVMDANYQPLPVTIKDNKDGTIKCEYKPENPSRHTVQVNYAGQATPKSPYRVNISSPSDASKVKVFGPGVENGNKPQKQTHFNIDCKDAGDGEPEVVINNEKGDEIEYSIQDNLDKTYTVEYAAPAPGKYKVQTKYGGKEVPKSPIDVEVKSDIDVSKVRVDGLEPRVFKDCPTDFTIDAREVTNKLDGKVTCIITNPSGNKTNSTIENQNNGMYKVCYSPFEEGPHSIQITYDGVPIPGSPFKVNVTKGCDPSKCKAYGPGLEKGITGTKNTFIVETKGAGVGGLGLTVEGPAEAQMNCVDNRDGTCTIEYVPDEAGDYDIGIKFADQDIPGSPFKVPVEIAIDPKKVKLSGPGVEPNHCRANVPQKFTIDTTKAGKAPVDVQVTSEDGPISKKPVVKNNGDGTHTVEYMPPPVGKKCDVKVTHANQEVPQSPVKMKVLPTCEPNNVKVSGPGASDKPIPASIPVDVIIDAKTAGCGDLKVDVTGPEADPKKVKITDNGDGTYKATYVPEDVGDYKVDVKYGGHPVPKSPFKTKAVPTGQADKCKITEGIQETLNINEEYCITVNAQQAGTGAVTCRVRSSSISAPSNGAPTPVVQPQQGQPGDIDISIEDNGDGTFSIYYTVKESGDYSICVKFGGQNVPNGIYKVQAKDQQQTREIIEEEEVTVVETTTTQKFSTVTCSAPDSRQYNPVSFDNIKVSSTDAGLTAEVKMPSGKIDQPKIIDNKDGTVSVKFDPKEEGLHEMTIKYNHEHVEGSPFSFHVDKLKSGHVTAHGSGLTHGVCGEPCNFTITTKEAGAAGGLSLAVEGPSKAEISCKDNKDGTVTVTYLPTAPGEYKVSVKFADKHIIGSPYAPKITGEGRKRNQISVGHSSEVSLKVTEKDIKNLNASIIAPSGLEEPCFVKKLPNGHLGISFTPREKGEHSVNVKRMGNHIAKSPFKIQVGEREIGDASKVKVTGKSLKEGKTQTVNEFSVNTQDAGYGGLSLSIEGPSKADIQCKDNENGTLDVSYKPTEPGYYIINLKFADHHVPGSPYTIKVSGEGSGSQTERIKRDREAVPITEVGNECKFTFRLPGTNPFDMVARVTSPNGQTEDAEIVDLNDSTYAVHFVPKELGVHTISIRHKDIHIPGSPFQFTVGPLKEGGAHKVHAGGPGLERGEINQPCEFNVWTREAGAGHLAISVEGPSKAEIDFQDRKDGSCYVTYKVAEQGEYRVGIKFNDQHIPDSPYKAYITPSINDANKVMIGNLPDNDLHKDKPVNFVIHMNGAKGLPDGKVVGPDGHEDDCFISPVDDEQYALRFVPKMNGVHNIIISLAGAQVPESPLRLRVGKDEADPAVVSAFGNGLINTKTGQKADFIVDTCNAGSGTLAVTIDGPSKVSMDCTEVEEGYKVRYTPLSPGEYYVTVKYSGYHIAGSPFRVPCSGKAVAESSSGETSSVIVETAVKESKFKSAGIVLPKFKSNASKVTCKGLGLKKAYLNKQNQFNVSCVDAGNNMLYVSVIGPKAPVEEVYIKHQGNHSFIVNYMAKERGEHFVVVKYGEDNIPGSPFKVDVL